MKALIVDDEPWARFEMERLLAPYVVLQTELEKMA